MDRILLCLAENKYMTAIYSELGFWEMQWRSALSTGILEIMWFTYLLLIYVNQGDLKYAHFKRMMQMCIGGDQFVYDHVPGRIKLTEVDLFLNMNNEQRINDD